jgi:geranyl-CoA carboxylase alpha subunit
MKVLIANRGEIACRIIHTLREMSIPSVAVYTDIDAESPHVWLADDSVALGATSAYLDIPAVLVAAKNSGATAIHPGYGFLSQNAEFARECAKAGITFIGPSPEAMIALGDKRGSSQTATKLGIPVVPGARETDSIEEAKKAATKVGYPILVKAAGGGGGKGMRRVNSADELADAFDAAKREAKGAFADDRLLVEKYVFPARHVEVQILGDGKRAIALGERECSLQRRYQKVIEESPSTGISEKTRQSLFEAACRLATATKYASAGTVEFLIGPDESFYFLEVNSRLQVEHPVTEALTGIDLVRAQIEIAQGWKLPDAPTPRGHAIEARLYAEDPYNGYLPSSGRVLMLEWPSMPNLRIDTGIVEGSVVHPFYDPMLAKLVTWGATREYARRRMIDALSQTTLLGLTTNQTFLIEILSRDFFTSGQTFTTTLESETWSKPDSPEAARTAAAQILSQRSGDTGSTSGPADRYSPWRTLGAFRMDS